jgi:hypothetical protein
VPKLADLKKLIDERRASEPAPEPKAVASPPRRAVAASKHADGDVDLKSAFADVAPIKRANRASVAPPAPLPVARHRIADEEDALEASKYGAEPAPQSWEIGQEHEGEQTFLRADSDRRA